MKKKRGVSKGKQNSVRKDPSSPFHVAVDLPWDASARMGTGCYSESSVRAMARAEPGTRFTLLVTKDAPRNIRLENVGYESIPEVRLREEGSRQVGVPAILAELKPDCLFAPATLLPLVRVCPMVAVVHDLTYARHPDFYSLPLVEHLKRWLDPSLRAADHLIAISDAARTDLLELRDIEQGRITIVGQSVREVFETPMSAVEVSKHLGSLGIGSPFFFHVSNLSPHKNMLFALQVYADYMAAHPDSSRLFVFAGGGVAPNRPPDLEAEARKLGILERVRYVGRVEDDQLKALYQGCDAFLFPSLAEGWGAPAAEATRMGARVLASPQVPAAGPSQQFRLVRSEWVRALADRKAGREGLPPMSFVDWGRGLLGVLRQAVRTADLAPSAKAASVTAKSRIKETPSSSMRNPAGISGCTILRNGVRLQYPFEESIASYAPICDEIVVCWDPTSEDDTRALVERVAARFPTVKLVESVWDLGNRREGSELARQTQVAFDRCTREWSLYIQADEALHEKDHAFLQECTHNPALSGVAFRRSSYFRTLEEEIPGHRARGMVRMFRTGGGHSVGDAMHVNVEGRVGTILDSEAELFNYSRLGTDQDILSRCNNLHRFYHDESWFENREVQVELDLETAPYSGSHPAPMERSFRKGGSTTGARNKPRVSVHVIAREQDRFGADLLSSCLDAVEGYADQIVIVDNGLGPDALREVLDRRGRLPITLLDGRDVVGDFGELRNRAIQATAPDMTHVHKIDSDEVYLATGLRDLKELIRDETLDQVNATLVHFMIEPMLVESVQTKEVVFRVGEHLAWQGSVHERMAGLTGTRAVNGPARFLHFGYCRPQWQTMLKWLQYALLQGGDLSHYKYEFVDGVKRPWFREGRTPDTILEPRRANLRQYGEVYPPSCRPWLDEFSRSGGTWKNWVNRRVGNSLWEEWSALAQAKGSWEDSLKEVLGLRGSVESIKAGPPLRRDRKIHLLWPTVRLREMKATHQHWMKKAVDPGRVRVKVAVNTEEDRSELGEFPDVLVVGSERRGAAYPVYRLSSSLAADPGDIVVLAADDCYAPEGWDEWLMSRFESFDGAFLLNDGVQYGPVATTPAMTYTCLLRLNKILSHPDYSHLFADNELYDNLKELGVLADIRREPGPVFEHRHHCVGKRPKDSHDLFVDGRWAHDESTYKRRKVLPLRERLKVGLPAMA